MEISNKSFVVFCVAVAAVAVYVRAQSVHSTAAPAPAVEAPRTVVKAPVRHHGIPDSPMPPDPYANSGEDQAGVDNAPVTLEATPDTPPPVATAPKAPEAAETTDGNGQEDLTYVDDLGDMADPAPATTNEWQLSDRDMVRVLLGSMPEEQRDSFRIMWFNMSPDDRQTFLDQMRGSQQGG